MDGLIDGEAAAERVDRNVDASAGRVSDCLRDLLGQEAAGIDGDHRPFVAGLGELVVENVDSHDHRAHSRSNLHCRESDAAAPVDGNPLRPIADVHGPPVGRAPSDAADPTYWRQGGSPTSEVGGLCRLAQTGALWRLSARRDRDAAATPALEAAMRSEEHTSELQSLRHLVCRLLLEKKKKKDT